MSTSDNGDGAVHGNGEAERQPETEQQAERANYPTRQEFDQLVQQANEGSRSARDRLRRILDECPEIWQQVGDLARHAELSLISLISKEEWLLTESIQRQATELRSQLMGPDPTPLESMAVQRVVACWLQLHYVDGLCAQAEGELQRATFWLKRQSEANRQFHAAMKSLCMIRTFLPGAQEPRRRLPAEVPEITDQSGSLPGDGKGEGSNGNGARLVPTHAVEKQSALTTIGGNGHYANRIAGLVGANR